MIVQNKKIAIVGGGPEGLTQDAKKRVRLRRLMEYSYDVCNLFGEVFITDDKAGCALIVKPDKKTLR